MRRAAIRDIPRKWPGVSNGKVRKVWQNWAEAEDIDGLERWAARFGTGFRGVLAFVYHILPCVELPPMIAGTSDNL